MRFCLLSKCNWRTEHYAYGWVNIKHYTWTVHMWNAALDTRTCRGSCRWTEPQCHWGEWESCGRQLSWPAHRSRGRPSWRPLAAFESWPQLWQEQTTDPSSNQTIIFCHFLNAYKYFYVIHQPCSRWKQRHWDRDHRQNNSRLVELSWLYREAW